MNPSIVSVTIGREHDIVDARQRARQLAELVGFDPHEQTDIATAVSFTEVNALDEVRRALTKAGIDT